MLAVYFLLPANKFLYSESTKTPNTWDFPHFTAGLLKYLFDLVFLINFLEEKNTLWLTSNQEKKKVFIHFGLPWGLYLERQFFLKASCVKLSVWFVKRKISVTTWESLGVFSFHFPLPVSPDLIIKLLIGEMNRGIGFYLQTGQCMIISVHLKNEARVRVEINWCNRCAANVLGI